MEGDDYQRLLDIIAFLMKRSSQPEQSSFKDFTSRVLQAAVSPERRMSFLFRPNEATQGLQPSAETSPSSSISFETVGEGEDAQMLIRNDETGEIVGALRHDEIQAIRERMENAQGGSGLFVREKA